MKPAPTFEEVCLESWMTGSLKVKDSLEAVTLNKKTNIPLLIIWCTLIMGGISYFISKHAEHTALIYGFVILSLVVSAFFIGLALIQNRKPSILTFDKSSKIISSPRLEGLKVTVEEANLWLVPARVYRYNDRGCHLSQILTIYLRNCETEIPVFCEFSNILEKHLRRFAELTNVDFHVQDLRTIHAHQYTTAP